MAGSLLAGSVNAAALPTGIDVAGPMDFRPAMDVADELAAGEVAAGEVAVPPSVGTAPAVLVPLLARRPNRAVRPPTISVPTATAAVTVPFSSVSRRVSPAGAAGAGALPRRTARDAAALACSAAALARSASACAARSARTASRDQAVGPVSSSGVQANANTMSAPV